MRKLILLFVMIISACVLHAQPKPLNDSTWQLAFSDEFNGTSVDANTWWGTWGNNSAPQSYRVFYDYLNFNAVDTLTNEDILPYITPNFGNCTLTGTSLQMTSKKEHLDSCKVWDRWPLSSFCYGAPQNPPIACPVDSSVSFEYTTANLISIQRFKYGYFEIRMKMPDPTSTYANKGLGPNFWLYHRNDTSIWSEIDVFEFAGYDNLTHNTNYHTSNVHYQKYEPSSFGTLTNSPADTTHTGDFSPDLGSIGFNGNYHVFGIDWRPNKIDFYYDGNYLRTSNKAGLFPNKLTEMHMIIELNHPTTNFATLVDTGQTVFPFTYEIDYVRCWQYKQHCDSVLNICNFNYSTFDPAIYKQITAGGAGCNASIPAGKNVSFRANDFVLLQEGFEIGNNAEFLGDITPCIEYVNPTNRPNANTNFLYSPYLNTERIKKKNQ